MSIISSRIHRATKVAGDIALDPGVVFSLANIAAFAQSGSRVAFGCSLGAAGIAIVVSAARKFPQSAFVRAAREVARALPVFVNRQFKSPLRVNAWTLIAPTLAVAATSRQFLPMAAGVAFSSGSFVATDSNCVAVQQNASASGMARVATCPAVHWGFGYSCLGLLAGGYNLETALGIGTTAASVIGLVLGKFSNPAAPFMILVHATAINGINAAMHGNWWGVANMALAGTGEYLIARMVDNGHYVAVAPGAPSPADSGKAFNRFQRNLQNFRQKDIFGKLEFMNWPLRIANRCNQPAAPTL